MGIGQTIDDYTRILGNGLSFGGFDHLAAAPDGMTVAQENAATQAARQRQGFAGDVANVATMLAGGKALINGVRVLPAAARTVMAGAPAVDAAVSNAALNIARSVGLMPGITRAEALARLGLDAGPSMAERALGTVGNAAKAVVTYPLQHPVISALVGTGALSDYAARNGGQPAAAATPASSLSDRAAAVAQATAHALNNTTFSKGAADVLQGAGAKINRVTPAAKDPAAQPMNPDFAQLVGAYQAANGGKISLTALSALADIAGKTSLPPRPPAPVTQTQLAAQNARIASDLTLQRDLKTAQGDKEVNQAWQDYYNRNASLAGAKPYDPLSGNYFGGAVDADGNPVQ